LATIEKQTLSLDDVEPDNEYLNCTITVSNQLIRINEVVFDHCAFEQSNFDGSDWGYVSFKGCNFLNASFHKSYFSNCQFTNVQLMGADFSMGTLLKKCQFRDSNLHYANFSEIKLEDSFFVDCNLVESSFQAVTVKKALSFNNCDVNQIDFLDTRMKGIDLSKATFDDLIVNPELIAGLKINPWQAGQIVAMLGVIVED
jgi:uncharacterized protein YjbI with pentapeptide repeats